MSSDEKELNRIRKELETIGVALTILAMNETGAEDAEERKRHENATQKGLDFLLNRIEKG